MWELSQDIINITLIEMSAIQAAIEKMKKNRAAVKEVVALMLCDIHNSKETMAELSSDACERKEIPPAY